MIIIDSSIFIEWIRNGKNPAPLLRPYIEAKSVLHCGIIRVEVLRGIRKDAVKSELANLFDTMEDIPHQASLWKRTSDLAWELDRKGVVLPISDLVIGACALQYQAAVVTRDAHFNKIPGLTVLGELPDLRI